MNFVSIQFLGFFLVVLLAFWGTERVPEWRRVLLLGANIFFYAFSGLYYVPLILTVAGISWGAARAMAGSTDQRKRRYILWGAVFCLLFLLAFFKYYEFFFLSLESLCVLLGGSLQIPLEFAEIAFPIGISFYSFQAIAYCAEQYKNPSLKSESYLRILVYLSFFPTVLAGPIMRPGQFFPQYDAVTGGPAAKGPSFFADGACQPAGSVLDRALSYIISGLFKKVVLASYLSEVVVRDAFQAPETYSSWGILVAVYGYAVQIYCDFSGYTDLALGVALLLGFSLPRNFAAPYLALNLQDFWRRWHISLSSWLRDYLYIPLGGSKKGNRYINLCVTMLLGGLWHGAHARFLVWGALHGGGLAVVHGIQHWLGEKRPSAAEEKSNFCISIKKYVWQGIAWLVTFHFVCFAWIFFRAEDMERAFEIIRRLCLFGQPGEGFAVLALLAIFVGIVLQALGPWLYANAVTVLGRFPLFIKALVVAIVVNCIFRMGPEGVMPFIYFQF